MVVNELQPNYRFVACATERLSKDVKITADSDDNLVSAYNKANDTEYNILPAENYSFTNKTVTIENGESVSGDEHNLVRTKAQFKLLQSVEANTPEMIAFINDCLKN